MSAFVKKKDPRTKKISIESFLERFDYLKGVRQSRLWDKCRTRYLEQGYFKFTPTKMIWIYLGTKFVNYGEDIDEKIEEIVFSERDGVTEYALLDSKLNEIVQERENHKRSKKLDAEIAELSRARKLLPKYQKEPKPEARTFDGYIVDGGYKASDMSFGRRFVVFDVETNGTRKACDDLLSLAIYDPATGECYNRLFPLDMQPLVLKTEIHGITERDLDGQTHMSQPEMDWLIDHFDLTNKTLLSYSGGQGKFDADFVINYCKRHGINGFEGLSFENIKNHLPVLPYGVDVPLAKDNMCEAYGIEGVNKTHSAMNDCLLEWKLFEKVTLYPCFYIGDSMYRYKPGYVIPITYLSRNLELIKTAGISLPKVVAVPTEFFRLVFPQELLPQISKFPTNITGITVENAINSMMGAERDDNLAFLAENKAKLEHITTFESKLRKVVMNPEADGTMSTPVPEDKEYVEQVNAVSKTIMGGIAELIRFMKQHIFHDGQIKSQELVISEDGKLLSLCDLSNEKAVVEIKTANVIRKDEEFGDRLDYLPAYQLYYQAKGRSTFLLQINYSLGIDVIEDSIKQVVSGLTFVLYSVSFREAKDGELSPHLGSDSLAAKILEALMGNGHLTIDELKKQFGQDGP